MPSHALLILIFANLFGLQAPLVFVAHSMGGLVVKKAHILAQQMHEFVSIAERVHTIFFLATPHRGSDLAALLTKIMQVGHGAGPFVQDLHRYSVAIQSINDEFPHHCQQLQLFSFYETLPTSYIVGKSLVVEKESAILGYNNERTAYMHADHRDICKYAVKRDPNYQTVRNALASVMANLRSQPYESRHDLDAEQSTLLEKYLDMTDALEDDLINIDAQRMSGSCEWLTEKASFRNWWESPMSSQIFWVSAKPASGKTILSGYVVRFLRELGHDCGFYFFNFGDKSKATISSCLRSIACQLAMKHSEVLTSVLDVGKKDESIAKADYRTIWRKLFLEGIMKVKLGRPQFWVVDALDECKSDVDLIPLLVKLSETLNIRFFVTCRNRYESHGQMLSSRTSVMSEEISESDTKIDIKRYLAAHIDSLPTVDEDGSQSIIAKILAKSAGCFLWVKLVLEELMQVHTSTEVYQILEEIPSSMDELYTRILQSMSTATHGKILAKAILTWTVCSARPLTTEELYYALQLDIKDNINKIEKAISASCGQLVYVDAKSRVHMIHQTAREFLLQLDSTSEFAIEKKSGHKRLLTSCIRYLCSNEMKVPGHRKLSVKNLNQPRCVFVSYACSAVQEHIRHISSTDDEVFLNLVAFLNTSNTLSWIAHLAQAKDLPCIMQTGKSFKHYLQRRSRYVSPIGKQVVTLDSWATDLIRLVAKFGKILLMSPNSIFNLIPPFCPPESALNRQFASTARGIHVLGLSGMSWDDCLSTIVRAGEHLTSVACSDRFFATGSSNGRLTVYDEMTCQEHHELHHGESVRQLQFGETQCALVSSGMKMIRLWDVESCQELWHQDLTRDCLSLSFVDEDRLLLGALRNNQLVVWDCTDGSLSDSTDWTEDTEEPANHAYRRPTSAAICVSSSLLAVAYRGQDILVWDIESNVRYDTYGKETGARRTNHQITGPKAFVTGGLAFSRDPNATLLAAAYSDGELVVFELIEGIVQEKTLANAQMITSSPNGRTLATADSTGRIQIYDFETLRLLHCISAGDYVIKSLAFSGDNSRLLDIRGSECRVWDPPALMRPDDVDDNSDTVSVVTLPQDTTLEHPEDQLMITAMACHGNGEVIYCGKIDGGVYLYDASTGLEAQRLFGHSFNSSIVSLCFDGKSETLVSVDSSSRILKHKLTRQGKKWDVEEPSLDLRAGVAVDQILSNEGATRLLLCSGDKIISYPDIQSRDLKCTSVEIVEVRPHRCIIHPSNPGHVVVLTAEGAETYDWETLRRVSSPDKNDLESKFAAQLAIRSVTPCMQGRCAAVTFSEFAKGQAHPKKLSLWELPEPLTSDRFSKVLADQVQCVIGPIGQRVLFLSSTGWVYSVDPGSPENEQATRHFFIPLDWFNAGTNPMIDVTSKGDIILIKRDEVAVIKRGLETSEQGPNVASARSPVRGARRPPLTMSRSSGSEHLFLRPSADSKRPSLPIGLSKPREDISPPSLRTR